MRSLVLVSLRPNEVAVWQMHVRQPPLDKRLVTCLRFRELALGVRFLLLILLELVVKCLELVRLLIDKRLR